MRRRAILILLAVAVAVIVVAVVRHGRGGGPIPVASPVPATPRLARPLGAALDASHARDDATYRATSSRRSPR